MAEAWKRWEGQVVNGEFPLRQYLGGSEHSVVFLTGRSEPESQKLAIKLILATAENPELQLSWWELSAKLSHPHLLRLFQRGRCQLNDTELFYALMEYAEESLAQILPYRPLTPAEAHETLQPVLAALAYVHAKGFVHGHLKPSNIMAVGDQIKVSSDELYGVGESGRVLGTPDVYTAPEIVDGGGMSPASDVWSVGMMLVEALTQRLPLSPETKQTEVVIPETMPEPFFDIASHCLRRDPQHRWTVAEIAARLQQAPPAPLEKQTAEPGKASARWGYLAAAIAAGLLLWAVLGPRLFNRHSVTEPGSSGRTGSSTQQPEPAQRVETVQPAQIPVVKDHKDEEHVPDVTAPPNARPVVVKSSAHLIPGAVDQQVLPEVSRQSRNTIHGKLKVKVRVMVDSSGKVLVAKFDSRGPSKYFADRALQAARRWTFKPPQVDGQGVPSEWILRFEFGRTGTNVHPAQTSP